LSILQIKTTIVAGSPQNPKAYRLSRCCATFLDINEAIDQDARDLAFLGVRAPQPLIPRAFTSPHRPRRTPASVIAADPKTPDSGARNARQALNQCKKAGS
jgi:hypothetical protein